MSPRRSRPGSGAHRCRRLQSSRHRSALEAVRSAQAAAPHVPCVNLPAPAEPFEQGWVDFRRLWRGASPRTAARVRGRRSWRRSAARGRVSRCPVRPAPNAVISCVGAHLRDAEELLDVAAGEPLAVQRRELADGVGDGEQPPGRGGHRGVPCRLQPLQRVRGGTMSGAHAVRDVSRWSSKTQAAGGSGSRGP